MNLMLINCATCNPRAPVGVLALEVEEVEAAEGAAPVAEGKAQVQGRAQEGKPTRTVTVDSKCPAWRVGNPMVGS
jgi:hypothetical protein